MIIKGDVTKSGADVIVIPYSTQGLVHNTYQSWLTAKGMESFIPVNAP